MVKNTDAMEELFVPGYYDKAIEALQIDGLSAEKASVMLVSDTMAELLSAIAPEKHQETARLIFERVTQLEWAAPTTDGDKFNAQNGLDVNPLAAKILRQLSIIERWFAGGALDTDTFLYYIGCVCGPVFGFRFVEAREWYREVVAIRESSQAA